MASVPLLRFSSTTPHFFKIILEDTSRHKRKIPKKFVMKYGKDLSSSVYLKLPSGSEWEVELTRCNGKVWFEKGWPEFCMFCSLDYGSFLVFRYEGNSHFQVCIFDVSATEIDYPITLTPKTEDNDLSIEHQPSPKTRRKPPLPYPPYKKMRTSFSGKADILSETENTQPCCYMFEKPITDEDLHCTDCSKLEAKSMPNREKDGRVNGGASGTQRFLKQTSFQVILGNAIALRRAYDLKTESPSFIVSMKPQDVQSSLSLPLKFVKRHFIKQPAGDITLQILDGRTWSVEFTYSEEEARFQGGWLTFVKDNNLEVGDVSVFVLIKDIKPSLRVVFFRASEATNWFLYRGRNSFLTKEDGGSSSSSDEAPGRMKQFTEFEKADAFKSSFAPKGTGAKEKEPQVISSDPSTRSTPSLSDFDSDDAEFRVEPVTKSAAKPSSKAKAPTPVKLKGTGSSKPGPVNQTERKGRGLFKKKDPKPSVSKSKGRDKPRVTISRDVNASMPLKKRIIEVLSVPPLSHFVNSEARTLFTSCTVGRPIVYEKGLAFDTMPTFVKDRLQALGLVNCLESLPTVNLTMVQEFYANFPEDMPSQVKLKSTTPLTVWVREKTVNISPANIRKVLGLPKASKEALSRVREYVNNTSLLDLAAVLYSDPSRCPTPEGHLSSQYMTEFVKIMGFVVRSLITPSTQTSKIIKRQAAFIAYLLREDNPIFPLEYFIFQAMHKTAVLQRNAYKCSIVFPGFISLLCNDAGVNTASGDAILTPIPPIDLTSVHKSVSQAGMYVESLEHTALKKDLTQVFGERIATAVGDLKESFGREFAEMRKYMDTLANVSETPKSQAGDSASGSGDKSQHVPEIVVGDASGEGESSDATIAGEGGDDVDADEEDV